MTSVDYSPVTEKAGDWVTPEAASMFYTRYRYAREFCRGKRILEVASGEGIGLRYLAHFAEHTVGADVTAVLLASARRMSPTTFPLLRVNGEDLPLSRGSRDVIICYEAIYYLADPLRFVQECRRVLAPGGVLLLCMPNPNWIDFNPSQQSRTYYSAEQLQRLLDGAGLEAELYGAFPVESGSMRAACLSCVKRAAVACHVMPKTMAGKRWLKRLFYGKLVRVPSTVADGMASYCQPVPISSGPQSAGYKILFAVARSA
jgi:SAM-dependent methyltransferase